MNSPPCLQQSPSNVTKDNTSPPSPPILPMPTVSASNRTRRTQNPGPSAPTPDTPPPYWKCEVLNFEPEIQPPPYPFTRPNFDNPPPYSQAGINIEEPQISREEVEDALEEYANLNLCYQKKLRKITVGEIQVENVFHYVLHTTTEMRKTKWKFEPYISQTIPGPRPAQSVWDIVVHPEAPFSEGEKTLYIPGTASVRPCQKCWGVGRSRCIKCTGTGKTSCRWCRGVGHVNNKECSFCNMGKNNCRTCLGEGKTRCELCIGHGQVYAYLELLVSWKVHESELITPQKPNLDLDAVPAKKISKKSIGTVAFFQTEDRLYPIGNFPHKAIRKGSRMLLEEHSKLQNNDVVIRQQKHFVRTIPVASIDYTTRNGKTGIFRTYGENHKVYFPDYPTTVAVPCSIS